MSDRNSFYCPSCKGYSSLTDRAKYEKMIGGTRIRFCVSECNSCDFHFLVTRYDSNGQIIKIWPKTLPGKVDDLVPDPIKGDFEEALVCEAANSYRGAAALARRTLQVICLNKGAPEKKKLHEQIDWLFDNSIITQDIKDWAHEVRYVGNDAAHPSTTEVTKDDARDILELLESMCDVLYIAPARAAARKAKRTNTTALEGDQ